jgi:hypothetical protein
MDPPVVVTCARGSSDHAAHYLKYLLETALGVPVASVGPSVASVYGTRLRLRGAVVVSSWCGSCVSPSGAISHMFHPQVITWWPCFSISSMNERSVLFHWSESSG